MRAWAGCGIVVLFLLVGFFLLFYQAGCTGSDETIRAQVTSPDGKHTATLIEGSGDATVGFFRYVVLCEGNGRCTGNGENGIASEDSQGIFNIGWASNDKLVIYYSRSYTKFTNRRDAQNGINIEYVPQGK